MKGLSSRRHPRFVLLALPLLASCEVLRVLGIGDEVVIGRVDFREGGPESFEVPETVAPGEPFTVTVVTMGGGCTRSHRTDVKMEPALAIITPYDLRSGGECTSVGFDLPHRATLTFADPGSAEVVFFVRSFADNAPRMLSRTVRVQ